MKEADMPNIKSSSDRQQGGMNRGSQRQQSQHSNSGDDRQHGSSKSQKPQSGRTHRSQQR